MFRIDSSSVVDATKQGSIARYVNHSCEPNCASRIITFEGKKKIVIFAQQDISVGEELTYDYQVWHADIVNHTADVASSRLRRARSRATAVPVRAEAR